MTGRPTKLTKELQDRICEGVRGGNYAETVAIAAGISGTTYYSWKARGETGEEPFASFLAALEEAERAAETRLIDRISAHGEKDGGWKPLLEILQRRFRLRWSKEPNTIIHNEAPKLSKEQMREEILRAVAEDPELKARILDMK